MADTITSTPPISMSPGSTTVFPPSRRDSGVDTGTEGQEPLQHGNSSQDENPLCAKLWADAFISWKITLDKEDFRSIRKGGTYESLHKALVTRSKIYKDRTIPKLLARIDIVLAEINSYTGVLNIFAQSHPVFIFVWGCLKLLIDISSRFTETINLITQMMEKLKKHLPRIEIYLAAFSSSERIQKSVLELYTEIIGFSVQAIKFLRKHPILALIRNGWGSLQQIFEGSLARIQECKDNIELEAFAANVRGNVTRHEELKTLLLRGVEPSTSETKAAIKLPCRIISFPRNTKFYGREDNLSHIEKILIPREEMKKQRSLALVGLGGIGKTQLALEFVWQHLKHFDVILWVQADSVSKLGLDFLAFARRINLVPGSSSLEEAAIAEITKRWFEETDLKWLIVFDNVDNSSDLKMFWPCASHGSILITTRNLMPSFSPAESLLSVLPFSAEEGSELLLRTLEKQSEAPLELTDTLRLDALRLADDLGGLPLAIAQSAGYILTVQCSLNEFRSVYEDQRSKCEPLEPPEGCVDAHYSHTLSTVWDVTLERMDEEASFLLNVLAYLDPDSTPERLFAINLPSFSERYPFFPKSKAKLFGAIAKLRTYDIVKRNVETSMLSVHRLVQQTVLQRMDNNERSSIFELVISILSEAFPKQTLGMAMDTMWSDCETFLPEVLVVSSHYKLQDIGEYVARKFVMLLHNATWFMHEKGMYRQLIPLVELACQILRDLGDSESVLMGELYNTLGNVYLEIGNLEDCDAAFVKVQNIRVKNCDKDDPIIANIMNNLSLAKTALGDYETALSLSKTTIAFRENLDEEKYSKYKENTLPINYSNICRILLFMGKLDEAAEAGRKAIVLAEKAFGSSSKNSAQAVFNLADVYTQQGLPEAMELHSRALKIRKDILGNHYQTAGSCYKVACLLRKEGDAANARALLEEALLIYKHTYFGESGVARTLYMLSVIAHEEGEAEAASALQRNSEEIRNRIRGHQTTCKNDIDSYDALIPYVDR